MSEKFRFIGGSYDGRFIKTGGYPTFRVPVSVPLSLGSLFNGRESVEVNMASAQLPKAEEYERKEIRIEAPTFRYAEKVYVIRGMGVDEAAKKLSAQVRGLPEFHISEPRWVTVYYSKQFSRYGYCPKNRTLDVERTNGEKVRYQDVDLDTAADLYVSEDIDASLKNVADTFTAYRI